MKRSILLLSILTLLMSALNAQTFDKLLRHVVMFKFKEISTPADIKKVEDAFRALPSKISIIKSLEWGINNSPENLAQGFTHCFLVTFVCNFSKSTFSDKRW